jgi:hypothetical protein
MKNVAAIAGRRLWNQHIARRAHRRPAELVQWLGAVCWTPQRDILVLTGSGSVARLGIAQTLLISPLRDGRYLVTADTLETDLSGISVIARLLNARFSTLLRCHRRRMARRSVQLLPFAHPSAYAAIDEVCARRLDRLVTRHRAHYLDETHGTWSYTLRGAALLSIMIFSLSFVALAQIWRYLNPRWTLRRTLRPLGTDLLTQPPRGWHIRRIFGRRIEPPHARLVAQGGSLTIE